MSVHLEEDELILLHYGESEDAEVGLRHLDTCPNCAAEFEELGAALGFIESMPVPERDEAYSERVWNDLVAKLDASPAKQARETRAWFTRGGSLALAASILLAVFLAGRFSAHRGSVDPDGARSRETVVRERILLVAVGEHLQRSERLLTELANSGHGGGAGTELVNVSFEREQAEYLIGENRLFRQSAGRVGEDGLVEVLESLERVLLDVAHSSDDIDADRLATLQQRIESQGLLFKVKVIQTEVGSRQVSEAERF